MTQLRQSPRLHGFDYRGFRAYFVTSVTRRRHPAFNQKPILDLAITCLVSSSARFEFELVSYCFMPDHLHLLAIGQSGQSDLREFVRQFKQRSSFLAKQVTGSELWQISYHDHVLRNSEAVGDVARYIWANPVRGGLVEDYREYLGSGPQPLPDFD